MVKGGPAERRRYLDDTLVALRPRNDALRTELDRVLRQRNALLKQSGGRLSPEVETTLEVWDTKLVEVGESFADKRLALIERPRTRDRRRPTAEVAGRDVEIRLRVRVDVAGAGSGGGAATGCAATSCVGA